MTMPTFHDVELISAFLDGQLSQADKTRMEARLHLDADLAAILADLRQACAILRQTPRRRLPRNFTLTPRMAGIKPPVPRLVPVFSWASVVAMLAFIFTLGGNLIGRMSFGAAAPMMAAAPGDNQGYGVGGGPAAVETAPPSLENAQATPTPENLLMMAPQTNPSEDMRQIAPPSSSMEKAAPKPLNPWLYVWLGSAMVLITIALIIRLGSIHSFRKKAGKRQDP